jgi:membrane-bound lytic murein transglycosylase D
VLNLINTTIYGALMTFKIISPILIAATLVSCSAIKPKYGHSRKPQSRNIWFKRLINENKSVVPTKNVSRRIQKQINKTSHIPKKSKSANRFLAENNGSKVKYWKNYLGNKERQRFQRFINNGEKYRTIIESVLAKHNLPKELYYVGLIESGYYLGTKSHAGAAGPWQFMRSTGKMFKLKINKHVDERRNIYKATEAAALYYTDLYNIFGSWELALAAYNKGENGIIRRIRQGNTRDYYELSRRKLIPKETRNYVPKIIAAMKIYSNPKAWGLHIPRYDESIYDNTKTIKIRKSMSLKRLASSLGIKIQTLKALNPELIGYYTPFSRRALELRVPNRKYNSKLLTALLKKSKKIPSSRSNRSRARIARVSSKHKTRRGENLSVIARKYGVKVSSIKRLNRISHNKIYVGQKLLIPTTKRRTYIVKRGDNLTNIARKLGISLKSLMEKNGLKKATIFPGQRILIALK